MGQVAEGVYGNFVQMVTAADFFPGMQAVLGIRHQWDACEQQVSKECSLLELKTHLRSFFISSLYLCLWTELCTLHPQLVGCSPGLELPECDSI